MRLHGVSRRLRLQREHANLSDSTRHVPARRPYAQTDTQTWRSLQAQVRRRQGLSDRRAPAIASEITDPAQERESQWKLDMAPIDVQMNTRARKEGQ